MDYVNIALGVTMAAFCCGYYLGERGLTGVKNDLGNVKTDISNLKGKIDGTIKPEVIVTPPAV